MGMRRGDLSDLKWSEVSDFSIERVAGKSSDRRRLTVPLIASARATIGDLKAERLKAKTLRPDRDLHLHDLRGTAVTAFCQAQLTDEEIADIMAWEPAQVRAIRKRYVDRERIAQSIVARLEKEAETG